MIDLCRLCYVSRSRIPLPRRGLELEAILSRARANNLAADISGVLIVSGPYFCQVLEGSSAAVENIFEAIQLDSRHEAVTVLEFVPVRTRMFADWQMAFHDVDHQHRDGRLRALVEQLQVVETGRPVLAVFEQLIQRREQLGFWPDQPGARPAA